MGLKPLGDRVLIKIEETENALPSGLVIPDTAKEKPQEGTVVAVGPGSYQDGTRVPLDVKEGDRVLFSKYGGTEVKVGGEEFMMLNERDVLAIVS
ncbi:MAG TPA: co-chaperone GroES [Actinomycetota bacterium]|jgi:chaperonin GroES|nr:co-chaperone GroES [Actinomycetota bacterium]